MIFIGIDNGVSGTIGVVGDVQYFGATPTIKQQNYTKAKAEVTRIDGVNLKKILSECIGRSLSSNVQVVLERPMVNPGRFKATTSALRALEATLIVLEDLGLGYRYIDSKEWQKVMLPKGVTGSDELKKASLDIGNRLFPQYAANKHKDRDGILMAEYLRKSYGI